MQIKEGINEVLHKMHVKLYPNYLQNVDWDSVESWFGTRLAADMVYGCKPVGGARC